jgi:hypothetical protein
MEERTGSMSKLEQTSGRTLASGEYPHCKTERDLVQDKTIECPIYEEPYRKGKWKYASIWLNEK